MIESRMKFKAILHIHVVKYSMNCSLQSLFVMVAVIEKRGILTVGFQNFLVLSLVLVLKRSGFDYSLAFFKSSF